MAKASRNIILGYTYQKLVAFFSLSKMDVESTFNEIVIEADVNRNFDDLAIKGENSLNIYCQVKDFANVDLSNIQVKSKNLGIDGKNILFFIKNIELESNSEILGIPFYLKEGAYKAYLFNKVLV
ncbi:MULTISPECIES: hypothetical protein [Bacillus]|uniref:hypothetical protein n=1 Tax=Bacillus TaxID=1386 RepID=UPI000F7A890F|nr:MULTISPECIES: hypothetical protein [Bacillus]MDJ0287736.1 hypothetical protein [Bacillus altitudinis]